VRSNRECKGGCKKKARVAHTHKVQEGEFNHLRSKENDNAKEVCD